MPGAPWWRPDRFAARRAALETRTRALDAVRQFFRRLDFTEVETPALQVSPGLEPHLQAFATQLRGPGSLHSTRMHLHTSPEFAMKKLLAGGMERIFQLARVYRNAERSATHHPEFTMLEWYRVRSDYTDLMDDVGGLLRSVAAAAGVGEFRWQGKRCDPAAAPDRLSVAAAFEREGVDLLASTDVAALAKAAQDIGVATRFRDRWDDIFFRIFLDRIEPKLGIGKPTILYDYPASMAALSRLKKSDPRVCERFEVYVCGLELANAFGELTDPAEQRRRFEADMALKQKLYGERYPIDEDFIAALEHGLPESAGCALGFDRLVMLAAGVERIEDVLWAPVAAAQGE